MSGKTRASLLSLTIIAVIVFSAFGSTIAYADGETTPESPPAEATTTPEGASTETTSEAAATDVAAEATATPEAAPAESEGTEAESAAEPTKETAPATEEAAPAAEEPVLTEVPENTTVTVVDANGEAQPLATQEAATAIAESDPIWCPAGAVPVPGQGGCTASFSSFTELLTTLSGNPAYSGAGTIYVQQGAYNNSNDPGGVIDFNSPSYDLSNIRNSDLTVTGGWNGSNAADPASTSNFTDTRILIGSSDNRWGGALTVNNITMTFSNPGVEIPATPENALTLYSAGQVELNNVTISNAPSAGVEIDAGGGVVIENSKFHRNKTAGAIVRATGGVTILDSEFQNPLVTRQRRQIVGLDVTSGGAVTLRNILASGNREVGVNIMAGDAITIDTGTFNGTMDIEGPRSAPTEFLGYGLQARTPGDITLTSIVANDNFLWGAKLDAGGRIAIANSQFNGNTTETDGFIDDTGLFITNAALVSLTTVEANDNRMFGAQINSAGNVSINDSLFNNNRGVIIVNGVNTFYGHGLQVTSGADILINNTDATGNSLFGAELTATGQVSINAPIGQTSDFSNTTTGPNGDVVGQSLQITSGGNTSLTNVVLNNNQTFGAEIQSGGTAWLENVTANDNGTDGVSVQATCVHLIGGTYSGNGGFGLNLNSSALNLLTPPTFSNNGSGNMNPASPPTCSFFTASTPAAASNIFTSLQLAPQTSTTTAVQTSADDSNASSENVSLSTFMAKTNAHASIFIGRYIYADSDAGIQVFSLVPAFDVLARD